MSLWRLKSRDPAGDAASLSQDGWMDGCLFDLGLREHTELYAHQADPRLMGDWAGGSSEYRNDRLFCTVEAANCNCDCNIDK